MAERPKQFVFPLAQTLVFTWSFSPKQNSQSSVCCSDLQILVGDKTVWTSQKALLLLTDLFKTLTSSVGRVRDIMLRKLSNFKWMKNERDFTRQNPYLLIHTAGNSVISASLLSTLVTSHIIACRKPATTTQYQKETAINKHWRLNLNKTNIMKQNVCWHLPAEGAVPAPPLSVIQLIYRAGSTADTHTHRKLKVRELWINLN